MDLLGIFVMLILVFLTAILVVCSRLPTFVKQIICVALVLRVIGAALRYRILFDFYTRGDALRYYERGLAHAEAFRNLEFSALLELVKTGDWGTPFLELLSGVVLTFLGTSLFAEFLVFALGSLVGLICFGVAFQRSNPVSAWYKYLAVIMVFPSLWFWPASVGKEATIMLGLGISVMGFVGKDQKIQWPFMLGGGLLVYAVRPELAAVLAAAMLFSQWFSLTGRWTVQKVIQTVVFSAIALYGLRFATSYMGIEEWGLEGVRSYVETDPSRRAMGRTNVTAIGISLLQTPLAAVNVLLRPFPWEVTNIMVLASSLEVIGFLILTVVRRRNLMRSLRHWRSDRLLRLAVIMTVLYPVALGMMVVNLGIIARQRVLLYPFLFVLLEAQPRIERASAKRRVLSVNAARTQFAIAGQAATTSDSLLAPRTSLSRTSIPVDSQANTNG